MLQRRRQLLGGARGVIGLQPLSGNSNQLAVFHLVVLSHLLEMTGPGGVKTGPAVGSVRGGRRRNENDQPDEIAD